jgi:hypothetical protein
LDPNHKGSKSNEFWGVKGLMGEKISSLQPNTPFCVGVKGTTVGSETVLDDCTASSSSFTMGFTNMSGTGTISLGAGLLASGLCLTLSPSDTAGGYQPMRKQGAIILATGGDNSNGAKGNFYEGFMATGYATDATDAAIQANIVAVGYSGFSTPH